MRTEHVSYAGAAGAATAVVITAAEGQRVTAGTVANGAMMGALGGAFSLIVAGTAGLGTGAALADVGAAAGDEEVAATNGLDAAPPTEPEPVVPATPPGMPDGGTPTGESQPAATVSGSGAVGGTAGTLPEDPFDLQTRGYKIVEHDFLDDRVGGGYRVRFQTPGGLNGVYHSGHLADVESFVEGSFPEELHLGPHYELYGPGGLFARLAPETEIPWWFE